MKRRELMLLLGGALTAARSPRAQQKAMPVVGYLIRWSSPPKPGDLGPAVTQVAQGLSEPASSRDKT
jgi:hypothetical protein